MVATLRAATVRLATAVTLLRNAEARWPTADANLYQLAAGYPTAPTGAPHVCPCHGDCWCPCPICACDVKLTTVEAAVLTPDPARHDRRAIEATIARCIAVCCDLLDIGYVDTQTGIQGRLRRLWRYIELVDTLETTDAAQIDLRLIDRHAATIHDLIARWAFEPVVPTRFVVGIEANDWCANHARYGMNTEPVSPDANGPWCDFCSTYQHNDPRHRRPSERLLRKRESGARLTDKDVA
jgi:hypothetical protein